MRALIFATTIASLCCIVASDSYPKPVTENAAIQEYLERLAESGYNSKIMPVSSDGHGKPVQVRCTFYLIDVHKVDDISMDYRVQFYFRQAWNDSRLAFFDQDISTVVLSDSKFIWTPDLFFNQEKEGLVHNLVTPNVFIRILPDGEVLFSIRLSVTFTCPMDFRRYPHDIQKCVFSVESYGFNRRQIQLSWDDRQEYHAVGSSNQIDLLTYEFKGIKEDIKHLNAKFGEYTKLEIELTFQRKVGFFITKLYLPYTFLLALSWLSVWIPSKLVLPRLSLLLVIMYLMVTVRFDINSYIPPASYTKGSDVWIAVCESLVFATFLEFVAVYIISRNKEKIQKRLYKNDPEGQRVLDSNDKKNQVNSDSSILTVHVISNRLRRDIFVSTRIDKASRVLFPVLFLIFNFVYWIVYGTQH